MRIGGTPEIGLSFMGRGGGLAKLLGFLLYQAHVAHGSNWLAGHLPLVFGL